MTHLSAIDAAREAATAQARRTLQQAVTFAQLHGTAKPLFHKTMRRPGGKPVLVRLDWPGVLSVFDPLTGECLARSEVGDVFQLEAGFLSGAGSPKPKE
ncbi:MAG: hypothetical protein KKG12_06470 [Gammaproteobacteria bacterium]|nr:hypothetical protein [Gammaproteobacteria bacterium]